MSEPTKKTKTFYINPEEDYALVYTDDGLFDSELYEELLEKQQQEKVTNECD